MSSVTYKHQPAINATKGRIPESGTSHVYRVSKVLWPEQVELFISQQLITPSLHVCCGLSKLGTVRLDIDSKVAPTVIADAARLPFKDKQFQSVLCDPPYNGIFQWNHDLLTELSRVAIKRIIFQHWFLPSDKYGRWKKDHRFTCSGVAIWSPKSYFGRVQVISTYDTEVNGDTNEDKDEEA